MLSDRDPDSRDVRGHWSLQTGFYVVHVVDPRTLREFSQTWDPRELEDARPSTGVPGDEPHTLRSREMYAEARTLAMALDALRREGVVGPAKGTGALPSFE